MSLDWLVLQTLIDAAPDGVAVCEVAGGQWPVTYVNRAFEQLTGYAADELIGKNLTLLQRDDRAQEGLQLIRGALRNGIACRTVLRNYRKDGTLFMNELQLQPIHNNQGHITHFASFNRAGSESVGATIGEMQTDATLTTQRLMAYVREDKFTGLLRRSYFEDLLRRDFAVAQRTGKSMAVMLFGIDQADAYRDIFGQSGAEQTFKRIARTVAGCFRRASDLCARWEDAEIITASLAMEPGQLQQFAETVLGRVRDLAIHHPRSPASRYVTISAGMVLLTPQPNSTVEDLIGRATQALRKARSEGIQRISTAA